MRGRCVRAFLAAMLVGGLYAAPVHAATKTFFAVLNGGQETPATDSNAFGVAFLTFDDKTLMLCYSITFFSLSGADKAAHLHGPAAPGSPAAILVSLTTANPSNGCVGFPKGNKKDLKHGMTYVNVHSTQNPGGEIRGQLIPVK